MLIGNPLP